MTIPRREKTKQTGVRIPESLWLRAMTYSVNNNVSLQHIVTQALTQYLDRYDKSAAKGKT
jgi:predicted HicB family RNase H-like nuclease